MKRAMGFLAAALLATSVYANSTKLFVGNLSFDTTENDLADTFAQFGTVTEVNLMLDRITGRPRGFAFVTMGSEEEAAMAAHALNGLQIAQSHHLIVEPVGPDDDAPEAEEQINIPSKKVVKFRSASGAPAASVSGSGSSSDESESDSHAEGQRSSATADQGAGVSATVGISLDQYARQLRERVEREFSLNVRHDSSRE
jgi:cold-inducible RNA-binding protein